MLHQTDFYISIYIQELHILFKTVNQRQVNEICSFRALSLSIFNFNQMKHDFNSKFNIFLYFLFLSFFFN